MPELPEVVTRARQMNEALRGASFAAATVLQPKCLNRPAEEFVERLIGQTILAARQRGKWIVVDLSDGRLLFHLGMGGELLLHPPSEALPEKVQAWCALADGRRLSLHFWWLGYLFLLDPAEIGGISDPTAELGPEPMDTAFAPADLGRIVQARRARIKSLLLDQRTLAGIGNMYSHDILFRALGTQGRLHPLRPAHTLQDADIEALWGSIRTVFSEAIALGGSESEVDLYGQPGRLTHDALWVGYKEGQPCPVCGTAIARIQTGSTAAFICPRCQPFA